MAGSTNVTATLLPAIVVGGLLVSSDPFTDAQAQHKTEVEPDTFTFGSTVVSAFQVGRVSGGGSSTDGGATWNQGFLPGTTADTGGPCGQISDAAAFDAKHNVWLISSLGVNCPSGTPVLTSRSTDGGMTAF